MAARIARIFGIPQDWTRLEGSALSVTDSARTRGGRGPPCSEGRGLLEGLLGRLIVVQIGRAVRCEQVSIDSVILF